MAVETILESVRRASAQDTVTAVAVSADPAGPVTLTASGRTLYADAYTGVLLGEGSQGMRQAMSTLRAWHRWLAVDGDRRPLARALTGWSNLLFAFLVVTGAYLWIPRVWGWSQLKAVVLFRRGASGRARDFNWHNVIGVWSAVPLFIVVVSAVPISFPWANAAVYRAAGEEPPAGRGGGGRGEGARQPRTGSAGARARSGAEQQARSGGAEQKEASPAGFAGLETLLARAEQQVPGWRTINLRIPESASAPVVLNIDRGDGGQPHLRSTLTLARATGDAVSVEGFSSLTLGRRIRTVMRFAHTGEVLGLAGQTVAGLVSAGAVVLVWTGIALAWRRLRAGLARRLSKSAAITTSDRTSAVA
jgi:uncharacterized iron-regulated membrane protein